MSGPTHILVLGAGGFIGSHLVEALLTQSNASVTAVDLDFHKLEVVHPRLAQHRASIDEPGLIARLVPSADVVVSLTALCNPALYNTDPLRVIAANYGDLVPVVEACSQYGRRLIHFSTCEVYGKLALDRTGKPMSHMSEDDSALFLGPIASERWSYACAKQLLERVIWGHAQHRQLEFTIVRPFNVIGPRMDFVPGVDGEGVPRVLACFMSALLHGEPLSLVDGGHQRRSFIGVEDFVEGVLRIIARPDACRGQIINLGNPANDVTVRQLAQRLSRHFVEQAPSAPAPRMREVSAEAFYGPGYEDSERRVPDMRKAERLLAWQPRRSLEELLPAIVESYLTHYGLLSGTERPQ